MGNNIFTIVGLLQSKGEGFNSTDNAILVPLINFAGDDVQVNYYHRSAYRQFDYHPGR